MHEADQGSGPWKSQLWAPNVLLASDITTGAKFDPADMINTIIGGGKHGCGKDKCVIGRKEMAYIVK